MSERSERGGTWFHDMLYLCALAWLSSVVSGSIDRKSSKFTLAGVEHAVSSCNTCYTCSSNPVQHGQPSTLFAVKTILP